MSGRAPELRPKMLVCRIGRTLCGIPLGCVVETFRPLPVEPVKSAPDFVAGLAMIRGAPTPVIDAACLLGLERSGGTRRRQVVLRLPHGTAALDVDGVEGIRECDEATLGELPPLLREAQREYVAALGRLDRQLFLVLEHARLVPATWSSAPGGAT